MPEKGAKTASHQPAINGRNCHLWLFVSVGSGVARKKSLNPMPVTATNGTGCHIWQFWLDAPQMAVSTICGAICQKTPQMA